MAKITVQACERCFRPYPLGTISLACPECGGAWISRELPEYADLADLSEDERIFQIGMRATYINKPVAFVVDSDPKDKARRYVEKLLKRFTKLEVFKEGPGPVPDTTAIYVRQKLIQPPPPPV